MLFIQLSCHGEQRDAIQFVFKERLVVLFTLFTYHFSCLTQHHNSQTSQIQRLLNIGVERPSFLIPKLQGEEHSQTHFYEATITLILKPDKDITHKKENYRPVSLINMIQKSSTK